MTEKITAAEIELALTRYFDAKRNFLIPNVKWGFRQLSYEIDVMVVTGSLYAYDIEIKISPADLKRDREKWKWNFCKDQHYFRKSYFAIPEGMLKYQDLIPDHAGVLAVSVSAGNGWFSVREVRAPKPDMLAKKITEKEYANLGRLCMLRMWALRQRNSELSKTLTEVKREPL